MADRQRVRIPPLRLTMLLVGTVFVLVGTVLTAVHGQWWACIAGVGMLGILASTWLMDVRPPSDAVLRSSPAARSSTVRTWARLAIAIGGVFLTAACVSGLITGNPASAFIPGAALATYGLYFTGPMRAGWVKTRGWSADAGP